MLGTIQTRIITSAAASCAKAIKQITTRSLKAKIKKALTGPQTPEDNYGLLNEIALKASVDRRLSASSVAALHTVQVAYQAVLDASSATRSDKQRQEMKALFHLRLLEGRARRKKAT